MQANGRVSGPVLTSGFLVLDHSATIPFVMKAWGDAQGATGKIRMLADTCGEFVKAADLELDLAAALGNVRCGRGGGV